VLAGAALSPLSVADLVVELPHAATTHTSIKVIIIRKAFIICSSFLYIWARHPECNDTITGDADANFYDDIDNCYQL
jgi:hypothetical protein